jgi:hypothetical protein
LVPSFFYPSACRPEWLPVGFQRPPSSLQAQAGNTGAADCSTTTSGGGGDAISDRRRLDEEAYREEASWRARTPTWESRISDQERGGFDLFCRLRTIATTPRLPRERPIKPIRPTRQQTSPYSLFFDHFT